jgi:hypothetical protein
MKKLCIVILIVVCYSSPDIFALPGTAYDMFELSGDTTKVKTKKTQRLQKTEKVKNYTRYRDIFELIRSEFITLRVEGSTVKNVKTSTMYMSMEVLYVVNDIVVSDISNIAPVDIEKIEFYDDYRASAYGSRGANGVIEIRLKTN